MREPGYNISDTGNWNVAADFSKLKIMKPLDACDHYENIAICGYDTFQEQIDNFGSDTTLLQIIGLERLINELLKLIRNTKFAIMFDKPKEDIEEQEKRLKQIRDVLPLVYQINKKAKGNKLKIDKKKFIQVLDIVLEIKSKINIPLNKSHLIFTDKEVFDPKKYKDQVIKNSIEIG